MTIRKKLIPENWTARHWFKRLFIDLIILAALLLIAGLFFKNQIMFQPDYETFSTPAAYGAAYSGFELKTKKGWALKGWHLPAPENANGLTILFFHGISRNMSMLTDRLVLLNQAGFEIVTLDWPGFGQSEGSPSEETVYEAAELAWGWLASRGIKPENTIIYGFSLGGGAASYLTQKYDPAALILDSTFTRLRDVPSTLLPALKPYFYLILGDSFNTGARLNSIRCPLLVIHSNEDDVVPYALGEANFQAYSNGPKLLASGKGDHMGFVLNEKLYMGKIKELEAVLSGRFSGQSPR